MAEKSNSADIPLKPSSSDKDGLIQYLNPNYVGSVGSVSLIVKPNENTINDGSNQLSSSEFMSSFVSPQSGMLKPKPKFQEMYLEDMGYSLNDTENWKGFEVNAKPDVYEMIAEMCRKRIFTDIKVSVGSRVFDCHLMLLQSYSEYFMEFDGHLDSVQLPESEISADIFEIIYDWMLFDEPHIMCKDLVMVYRGASYLRVKSLTDQCWMHFDNAERYFEQTAYTLYLEARELNVKPLQPMMLSRICRYFLPLVASVDFVSFGLKEVIYLLSMNQIGVNSEVDILYAATRWLYEDWNARQKHMLDLMKCVRFGGMPSCYILELMQNTDKDLRRILDNDAVRKILDEGVSFMSTHLHYSNEPHDLAVLVDRLQISPPRQRVWVFDNEAVHHHKPDCPNLQYITYHDFLEYLKVLRAEPNHWESIVKILPDTQIICCEPITDSTDNGE